MNRAEYMRLKILFESFGRDVLTEFKRQYEEEELDLDSDTEHDLETVIKGSVKCFVLYMKAKRV